MVVTVPLLSTPACSLVGGRRRLHAFRCRAFRNASTFAMRALYVGLYALVFGIVIVTVACYEVSTRGAVGGQARNSVITNFLMILILGYFVTRLFY